MNKDEMKQRTKQFALRVIRQEKLNKMRITVEKSIRNLHSEIRTL